MIENFRLRVFRSVARHLSFTRAAEELLLTQPAVTQQIKALEDELDTPLFDRGGGQIRLTPGGGALLPYAEKLRALSAEAVLAVAAARGEHAGELTLGASQTIAQYLLPRLIAGFLSGHPRVRITARTGNTDEILDRLLAHELQMALIEGPESRPGLHIEPFMDDRLVLVVPPAHAWAGRGIDIAALAAEPVLMREFGSGSRRVLEQALAAAGLKPKDLAVRMEFDSTEGLLGAVEAGLGVAFASRWAVRGRLALGTLKLARVSGLSLARQFSLACPASPAPAGNVGAFRVFLLAHNAAENPRRATP